jgi:hypothetical protein
MADNDNIQSLFEFWDSIVFSHLSTDGGLCDEGGAEGGEAGVDEMDALMYELQLERVPTPEPALGEVPGGSSGDESGNGTAVGNQARNLAGSQVAGVGVDEGGSIEKNGSNEITGDELGNAAGSQTPEQVGVVEGSRPERPQRAPKRVAAIPVSARPIRGRNAAASNSTSGVNGESGAQNVGRKGSGRTGPKTAKAKGKGKPIAPVEG